MDELVDEKHLETFLNEDLDGETPIAVELLNDLINLGDKFVDPEPAPPKSLIALAEISHQMRPHCDALGAIKLRDTLKAFELHVHTNNDAEAKRIYTEVYKLIEPTVSALREHLHTFSKIP